MIIEKKKEEEKKPIGSLSTEVSKNIDARINEQDDILESNCPGVELVVAVN